MIMMHMVVFVMMIYMTVMLMIIHMYIVYNKKIIEKLDLSFLDIL